MTKKSATGIRLEEDEDSALKAAARADDRPVSALGRRIIADWLVHHGWLTRKADDDKPATTRKRAG